MRRLPGLVAALSSGLLCVTLLVAPPAGAAPSLSVSTVVGGLDQPWDVKQLPGGSLLITERDSKRLLRYSGGTLTRVRYDDARVWANGETGLMSLEVDPRFASNRRFYTCHGWASGSRREVRVAAWQLSADGTSARGIRNLVTGIPVTTGRHGGCRLLVANSGALLVGTGDAARGTNPRNLRSLGGKVLRVNRNTGAPVPGNPWIRSSNRNARLVLSYGHRNVQGLSQRRSGQLYSAEHGPDRNDEVNLIRAGGDYGWHPVPGYNERVPMTDHGLPGKQWAASWRSGSTTIASSGATFVRGSRWGSLEGSLAVAALAGQRVVFLHFNRAGRLVRTETPPELRQLGRVRSVTQIPGGTLLVTTANGNGQDRVVRVRPAG